jgi:hypothetical protein
MTEQPTVDVWVLGPLSAAEKELAWRVAGTAEAALGSREPALVAEAIAHLLGGLFFDQCQREGAEELNVRITQHIFERIEALTRENEALARAAIARAGENGRALP